MAFNGLLRVSGISLLMFMFSAPAHPQPFSQQLAIPEKVDFVSEKSLLFSNTDFEQLRNARINEWDELDLAPNTAAKGPLRFRRINLYAPDAQIIVSDGTGERLMNKSGRRFFVAIDKARSAGFSLDPATGSINGLLIEGTQSYRISNEQEPGSMQDEVRISSLRDETATSVFSCENSSHPEILSRQAEQVQSDILPSLNAMAQGTGVLFEAIIAIDTDNEFLWNKFSNNENAARNWIEDLLVRVNVIYERDLRLRLLLGTTILRKDNTPSGNPDFNADPEGFNDGLEEFRNYWRDNQQGVNRVFAALLTGKGIAANSFSGVAWVHAYCSNNYGYSFNRIGAGLSASFVAGGFGHEIGHNLGSSHTHCEKLANNGSDFVDTCYSGERAGCFSGTPACPAGGTGTIMSYCHLSPGGCSASYVFHPLIVGKLDNRIIANTPGCISEIYAGDVILSNGFEQ